MEPVTPAAPEPAAVTPPVADPVAPVTPPATEPATPPAEPEKTPEQIEDEEWAEAQEEIFPGVKVKKKEGEKDEPAKPEKTPEELEAEKAGEKKPDGEENPDDPNKKPDEATVDTDAQAAARTARLTARETAEATEAVKKDVREKLFADVPSQLQDADGDPISSIDDVQKLINPRTGETFTEEEAGIWLLSAQQQFNKGIENVEKQVDQIANTNIYLKDEADTVNSKFGEVLKANPEMRDRLWAQYEKTLVKDEASGVILQAPVSLSEFYEVALAPYATQVAATQTAEEIAAAEAAKAEAEAKAAKEAADKKQKHRAERSDIYAPNNEPPVEAEDKEWDEAIKNEFGDRLKSGN